MRPKADEEDVRLVTVKVSKEKFMLMTYKANEFFGFLWFGPL